MHRPVHFDELPPSPRKTRWGTILIIGLLLAASPLIAEGALCCIARWQAFYGPVPIVKTPAADAFQAAFHRTAYEFARFWSHVPTHPSYLLAVGFITALGGAFLLRGR